MYCVLWLGWLYSTVVQYSCTVHCTVQWRVNRVVMGPYRLQPATVHVTQPTCCNKTKWRPDTSAVQCRYLSDYRKTFDIWGYVNVRWWSGIGMPKHTVLSWIVNLLTFLIDFRKCQINLQSLALHRSLVRHHGCSFCMFQMGWCSGGSVWQILGWAGLSSNAVGRGRGLRLPPHTE